MNGRYVVYLVAFAISSATSSPIPLSRAYNAPLNADVHIFGASESHISLSEHTCTRQRYARTDMAGADTQLHVRHSPADLLSLDDSMNLHPSTTLDASTPPSLDSASLTSPTVVAYQVDLASQHDPDTPYSTTTIFATLCTSSVPVSSASLPTNSVLAVSSVTSDALSSLTSTPGTPMSTGLAFRLGQLQEPLPGYVSSHTQYKPLTRFLHPTIPTHAPASPASHPTKSTGDLDFGAVTVYAITLPGFASSTAATSATPETSKAGKAQITPTLTSDLGLVAALDDGGQNTMKLPPLLGGSKN
jgi:hypothetical protein